VNNGTYAPVSIADGGDNTKLYLGSANKLYYPNAAMTIGTHRPLGRRTLVTEGSQEGHLRHQWQEGRDKINS